MRTNGRKSNKRAKAKALEEPNEDAEVPMDEAVEQIAKEMSTIPSPKKRTRKALKTEGVAEDEDMSPKKKTKKKKGTTIANDPVPVDDANAVDEALAVLIAEDATKIKRELESAAEGDSR